jgi:Flp pilus assembly protein TadD
MSQDQHIRRNPRLALAISVGLAGLTLLVYARSFQYPFVNFDDPTYVMQNRHVQAGLTSESIRWAFMTFDCGNWHPLTWLSLDLDSNLHGGLNAGGFHLTNVVLHTVNVLLLFLVLGSMTGQIWRSAMVAALFALHPLHVESVAWVSERKDVLSTLFGMLTLATYLWYVRRPGIGRYGLVVLACGLGLLAKPMLMTLPFVLLLLDYWPLRRVASGEWRVARKAVASGQSLVAREEATPSSIATSHRPLATLVLEKLPLFALALSSCMITFVAQSHVEAVAPFEAFPLTSRICNALLAYTSYLGKMFWPQHLAVLYPHPGASVSIALALGAGTLLVAITVLVLGPGRRWPYLPVGWLWYLGTLVPVIGLVQVGAQGMADRYTYLPLIGVFLMLTWGVADLATAWRMPHQYLAVFGAAVVSACAVLTWIQVGYWSSSLHLWERAAEVVPNSIVAHMNAGTCYYDQRRFSDARKEFEKAAALDPKRAEPHVNLGNVLADLDLLEGAVTEYRKAIDLDPERALPHTNLGKLLAQRGHWREALTEYHSAIELDPSDAAPHDNLGTLLWQLGRLDEAAAEYRRAIELDPADTNPRNNLGIVLPELGQLDEASAELRKAIDLDPEKASPHNYLGGVFQQEGRLEQALAEYRTAQQLGDKQAVALVEACERQRALRARLPGLVAGRDQPADNVERLAFADLCRQPWERRYVLAARLYTETFRADSRPAEDLGAAHRFNAAGAAAAAGCGQGLDAAGLTEKDKAQLRAQALDWLQAELALLRKHFKGDRPQVRVVIQRRLRVMQRNPDLAGVRVPGALRKLPRAEGEAWQKLWQEVEALLTQASAPGGQLPSRTSARWSPGRATASLLQPPVAIDG